MNCNRPDKDVPGLICGHPLPCPFHTVEVNLELMRISKAVPLKQGLRLGRIGKILKRMEETGD
ncbi:hypothetical protein ES702_06737 [subsurface metagenome]